MPLWVAGSFGAMVGFVMVMPIIEVESMVTALFICYAYNADVLLLNDPITRRSRRRMISWRLT